MNLVFHCKFCLLLGLWKFPLLSKFYKLVSSNQEVLFQFGADTYLLMISIINM